ncbi:hypothetical protein EV127DRAFT_29774 [Xylaria flabelliformis]|nr:hypothetical protein EV127DRAFT_29774 [Xylaria flabelliformis]
MAKTKRSLLPTDYKWTVQSCKSVLDAQSNVLNYGLNANSEGEPLADARSNATAPHHSLSWYQPIKDAPDFKRLKYKTISKDSTADENMQRSASLAYLGSRLTNCHNASLKVKPIQATFPSRADHDTISTSSLEESDRYPPSIRRTIIIEPTSEYQQFYNTIRREIDRQRLEYCDFAKDDLASNSFTITKATRSKRRGRRVGPVDIDTRMRTTFQRKFKLICEFHRVKRASCNCHDFSKLEEGYLIRHHRIANVKMQEYKVIGEKENRHSKRLF